MLVLSKLLAIILLFSLVMFTSASPYFEFKQQAVMIPHPEKAHRGGEDAYFASN